MREDDPGAEPVPEDVATEGTPVCPHCLTPFDPYTQYYCVHCGRGVADVTPYVPFVNIRYNFAPFGIVWRKVWRDEETGFLQRLLLLLFMLLTVPIMVVIGLPFVAWGMLRSRRRGDETPPD